MQLPGYYGPTEMKEGKLEPVFKDWVSHFPFEFHIVYPDHLQQSRRVRRLIDFIVADIEGLLNGYA